MYHCDTFDMYFHWKQLQKRAFLDRDFGCKVLMARPFNCGSRNAEFNAALIPALRAATVSPRRRCIARPRRNAERGLGNRGVIATFLHFFRQTAYRGLGTARWV